MRLSLPVSSLETACGALALLPIPTFISVPSPSLLPPHASEFIQLLSSESNEVATRESRSIIHPDHVLRALSELGFPGFVGEVTAAWDTFKEETKSERHLGAGSGGKILGQGLSDGHGTTAAPFS